MQDEFIEHIDMSDLIQMVHRAGEAIMEIYVSDFAVWEKEDASPLTQADQASHEVLVKSLQEAFPEIPVLSEEGKEVPYEERKRWERCWLVDPLDGTKEFIKRNGEFTVNLALVVEGYPVLGLIGLPAQGVTYTGAQGRGAVRIASDGTAQSLQTRVREADEPLILVESRSHPSVELEEYIERLALRYPVIERLQRGSSLKFCAVAEGLADLYPRFGPTMLWDTAAGQAVVEAAGGAVVNLQGERLRYDGPTLKNRAFVATAHAGVLVLPEA